MPCLYVRHLKDGVDNQNQGIQIADTKYTDIIGNYINLNDKNIEGVPSLVMMILK